MVACRQRQPCQIRQATASHDSDIFNIFIAFVPNASEHNKRRSLARPAAKSRLERRERAYLALWVEHKTELRLAVDLLPSSSSFAITR